MTTEERLQRLERQNRVMKVSLVLLVAVVGVFVLGSARQQNPQEQEKVPDVVKARAFHVVSKEGKVLVKIEDTLGLCRGEVGTITTLDGKGQKLLQLGASKHGHGTLTTFTAQGPELAQLGVSEDGTGTVTIKNAEGQNLVRLMVTADGNGMVVTMNGKGQNLVMLGAKLGVGEQLFDRCDIGMVSAFDTSGLKGPAVLAPR